MFHVIQQHKRYQYKRPTMNASEDRKEEVIKKDESTENFGYVTKVEDIRS